MKRRDLIKLFEKNGWTFKRAGGNRDVYVKAMKGKLWSGTVKSQALAQAIIRRRG